MFILTILEKIKETRLKFSQFYIIKARVKLTNTKLNKLKFTAKNKTGTILRLTKKNFEDEELPSELLLTTRQITN